ncbi:MAG: AEC family transporter [Chloroflexi bacterium]|nr:AEC family transporter [Chloroflexota bacterium]MBI3762830.1 AEC family transporter [Chloroflexota bacterium]
MSLLALILVNNLLPIFLVAGAAYLFGRLFQPDLKTVSRLAFYIFSPCLVFTSLTENHLPVAEFWRMAAFSLATILTFGVAAGLFGRLLRLDRRTLAGLVVVTMFGNGGNYGLSLNLFAFGPEAVSRAVVYYITSTVLVYTLGVTIASSGHASLRQSVLSVLKVPAIYGMLLAAALNLFNRELPLPLLRPIDLMSKAAIPVMLIVLGLQLAQARRPERIGLVTASSVFQLVVGPIIGLAFAAWLGLRGVARQAAVVEAAMPTAVITTILAVEYEIDPVFVTGVVLVTTLLSPLTLTPLLAYLGAG